MEYNEWDYISLAGLRCFGETELWMVVIPTMTQAVCKDEHIAAAFGMPVEEYQEILRGFGGLFGSEIYKKHGTEGKVADQIYFDDMQNVVAAVREFMMPAHLAAKMSGVLDWMDEE